MTDVPTATEISIPGANCSWCLNETLDVLRAEPGVVSVATSITEQCLRVEQEGVDTDHLLEVVRVRSATSGAHRTVERHAPQAAAG